MLFHLANAPDTLTQLMNHSWFSFVLPHFTSGLCSYIIERSKGGSVSSFKKFFKVECGASNTCIGVVLSFSCLCSRSLELYGIERASRNFYRTLGVIFFDEVEYPN